MNQAQKNILSFPSQLRLKGLVQKNLAQLKGFKPDGLIIIGMGGSGLPGNILAGLGETIGLKAPVQIWKNYGLPKIYFKKPLYLFVSFSGNTEETISGLQILLKKRPTPKIGIVTTGGTLKKLAEKHKLAHVTFPARNLTPREGLGYNYYSLIKLLRAVFPSLRIQNFDHKLNPKRFQKEALSLAKFIHKTVTVIYTDSLRSHLGYIWKTNLNETAKQPAFANTLPEMNHNEITVFEKKSFPFSALFLKSPKIEKRLALKTKLTEKLLKKSGVKTKIMKLVGKSEEERTWNSIILSNLTAMHLAKLRKVNPAQTRLIDQLKKMMK